ncbi:MAG: hypothetical protein LBH29_04485 [Elusimicrobiota bacterium]|nr:hypothetical protein [Elusimicrobiota bacterium]
MLLVFEIFIFCLRYPAPGQAGGKRLCPLILYPKLPLYLLAKILSGFLMLNEKYFVRHSLTALKRQKAKVPGLSYSQNEAAKPLHFSGYPFLV